MLVADAEVVMLPFVSNKLSVRTGEQVLFAMTSGPVKSRAAKVSGLMLIPKSASVNPVVEAWRISDSAKVDLYETITELLPLVIVAVETCPPAQLLPK